MKQKRSDAQISVLLKNKLVDMLDTTKDVNTVVALTNAYAKLRSVELKQEEGDWGADLPTPMETTPNDVAKGLHQ